MSKHGDNDGRLWRRTRQFLRLSDHPWSLLSRHGCHFHLSERLHCELVRTSYNWSQEQCVRLQCIPGGTGSSNGGGPGQGSDYAFRGPPSAPISTITRAANKVTVDASVAAAVGELVLVQGVADPNFNGVFTVSQVNSNSEFVYLQTGADATSSGGTVSPPPSCGQIDSNPGVWTPSSGTTPPLQIYPPTLPGIASGVAYDAQLTATGGSGTGYTWCVLLNGLCDASQSLLPQHFSLNESTGLISTTGIPPDTPGPYPFTVQVTDSNGKTAAQDYNLAIGCAVLFPNSPALGVQPFSGFKYGPQYFAVQFVAPNLSNPPSLTALQDYATSCGFTKFEWQQFITSYPAYAGTDKYKHDWHVPNYPSYFPQNVYPALCSGPLVSNPDLTVNLISWASYSCTEVAPAKRLP